MAKKETFWRCQGCRGWNLCVYITTTATLIQTPEKDENEFQTDTFERGGDHEWDGDSFMVCNDCGNAAKAHEFETTDTSEDDDDV